MFQLGWEAGTEQYSPDELLDYESLRKRPVLIRLKRAIIFIPGPKKPKRGLSGAGAIVGRTKKIILGTGVSCPILTCNHRPGCRSASKGVAARTVDKARRERYRTPNLTSRGRGNPNLPLEERTKRQLSNPLRN
jgi:hypothetical protein